MRCGGDNIGIGHGVLMQSRGDKSAMCAISTMRMRPLLCDIGENIKLYLARIGEAPATIILGFNSWAASYLVIIQHFGSD